MNFKELVKSKTFWTGISAIVAVIGSASQGVITWGAAVTPILVAAIGIFLKDGLISQTNQLTPKS